MYKVLTTSWWPSANNTYIRIHHDIISLFVWPYSRASVVQLQRTCRLVLRSTEWYYWRDRSPLNFLLKPSLNIDILSLLLAVCVLWSYFYANWSSNFRMLNTEYITPNVHRNTAHRTFASHEYPFSRNDSLFSWYLQNNK